MVRAIWTYGLVLAGLLMSSLALGHPHYNRVKSVWMAEENLGSSYGGYGYIMSSEAEATASLEFGCSQSDQHKYVSQYCGHDVPADEDFKPLITAATQAAILEQLRAHAAEFIALQLAAVDGDRSQVPACFRQYPEIEKTYKSLPPRQASDDEIKAAPEDRKLLLGKFRATGSQLTAGNMVRALLFHDQMAASEKNACRHPDSSLCSDLRNQLQRVESSFPVLFPATPREFKGFGVSWLAEYERKPLKSALQELLGARFPGATTAKQRQEEGAAVYNAAVHSDASNALNELEQKIATGARDAREQDAATDPKINAALAKALADVNAAAQKLRENYMVVLCKRAKLYEGLNFAGFLLSAPNVVRQALAEMTPKQRSAARVSLCQSGYLGHASQLPDCEGVRSTSDPKARVTSVDRSRSFFPFAVDNNYRITTPKAPPGSPPVISLTVNVESTLSDEATQKMVSKMSAQSNSWFNCQCGAVSSIKGIAGLPDVGSCPVDAAMADPRMGFKFEFKRVPRGSTIKPLVSLHKCYRAELQPPQNTDCQEVKKFSFTECKKSLDLRRHLQDNAAHSAEGPDLDKYLANISMPPPAIRVASKASGPQVDFKSLTEAQASAYCNDAVAKLTAADYNREDAGNYTTNTTPGTVLHEVGHLLGLPDEYADPAYPFLPLGEHNSLMNDSGASSRLYPRHLKQILAPGLCPAPGKGGVK